MSVRARCAVAGSGWFGLGVDAVVARSTRRGAGEGSGGFDDQDGEQAADLVAGQRDQPGRCGTFGVLVRGVQTAELSLIFNLGVPPSAT
jgi:phage tail tape-measure protein